jgi:hypothetical protein
VVVVDGNYEFYGADCITLLRCPTNSIVLAGYDATPQPADFPAGIVISGTNGLLVVYAGGHGYAIVPVPDSTVPLVVKVSNSPLPDMAEVWRRIEVAKAIEATRQADKAKLATEAAAAAGRADKAASVAALRAEVKELGRILQELAGK